MYWDERDHYSKEQRDLLERLNANYYAKGIFITELGTVCEKLNSMDSNVKEIIFDEYMDELERRVLKEESAIKYDNETNKFYLVEKERDTYLSKTIAYEIDISDMSMENYAFGKYDKVTSRLHDLYMKSMTNEEKQNLIKRKEKEKNDIIAKMNTGHELPTPAEARIYLDYLEELENSNAIIIKGKVKSIFSSSIFPPTVGVAVGAFASTLPDATISGAVLYGLGAMCAGNSLNDLILMIKKDADYKGIPGMITIGYIKKNISEIKAKLKENKVIETKASKLREIENIDKMVVVKSYSIDEFDKTLEDEKLESLNLKNSVMKDLDELVNRINLLNPEDKKELLLEVKEILEEYTRRYNNIVKQDTKVIDMEADNYMKLKIDTLTKIAELEARVAEIRQKDIEIKQVTDESRLLADKIDGFSEFDDLDLQKIHENASKKVKIKSLRKIEKI